MMNFLHDPTGWVLISFIVFVAAAFIFGRKSVVNSLDDKIEAIRNEIATAEALRNQAQQLLADYQRKQEAASEEATKIIEHARTQAAALSARAEEEFENVMARKEAMMKERLLRMEDSAMDDIRRYAADLAVSATARIIAEKMDERSAQKLVDDSIGKIAENLN
jgi:F-type H+-transporting ATPase subunit b